MHSTASILLFHSIKCHMILPSGKDLTVSEPLKLAHKRCKPFIQTHFSLTQIFLNGYPHIVRHPRPHAEVSASASTKDKDIVTTLV